MDSLQLMPCDTYAVRADVIRTETEAIGLFVGRRRPTAEEVDGLADVFSRKVEMCFNVVFALRFGLQIESLSSYQQKHQTARSERLPCLRDGKHDQRLL